jgi:hypothetical protein
MMNNTSFTITVIAVNTASVIALALINLWLQARTSKVQLRVSDEGLRSAREIAQAGWKSQG